MIERFRNGVTVYQVTDGPQLVSNIYCEQSYSSPDSRAFLYARQLDGRGGDDLTSWEYVLCEFGSWKERVVGAGRLSVSVSYNQDFYYVRDAGAGTELVRIDLATGESEVAFRFGERVTQAGHPAISPDRRWLAYHFPVSFSPQMFAIELVDMQTGARRTVCRDRFLCNGHLQFCPTDNEVLLVQHNRGCEFTPEGKRLKLVGDEGATLFLFNTRTEEITRLAIGLPHTPPITGHEAWIKDTGEVIATVRADGRFDREHGNTIVINRHGACRHVAPGWAMGHVGVSACGRWFWADGAQQDAVIAGSTRTGQAVFLAHPRTRYTKAFGQQAHPHAYLSPDRRWAVFNSDRTGKPETYAASIPPEVWAPLEG